jgi:hypothetical protein
MTHFRILNSYPRGQQPCGASGFSDRNSELSIKYWSDPLSRGIIVNHQFQFSSELATFLLSLVAATGRTETDLLEESIQLLAMRVLRQNDGGPHE